MPAQILIIKASCDICQTELDHIKTIAEMFSLSPVLVTLDDIAEFERAIFSKGPFRYVYLCTHASPYYFGESDGNKIFAWDQFATSLCAADCLDDEAVLMLACCRGGLRKVAETLFQNCDHIDYICGPRWTLTGPDISTGFHVFIYNMLQRREQPSTAVKRASRATGYDFFCYDRVELENVYL